MNLNMPKAISSTMRDPHIPDSMPVAQVRRGLERTLMVQGKSRAQARASISRIVALGERERQAMKVMVDHDRGQADEGLEASLSTLLATIKAATPRGIES